MLNNLPKNLKTCTENSEKATKKDTTLGFSACAPIRFDLNFSTLDLNRRIC